MIIDIQNEETTQATPATDAKPAKVSKGSPELRGKVSLRKCSHYLDSPKMENGKDLHAGRQFYDSNIPNDMIHPSIMEKTLTAKEMKDYRMLYAESDANFLYTHSTDCKNNAPRSKGKQMDGFRFILSCKQEELYPYETDEQQAEFLCTLARTVLQKMSGSKDINFYYKIVPHLKDGNPHAHIMMSSYTIDGQYYSFFRGKQDHGLIKLFDDVKFDLEEKYPHLLQMEHEKREKNRLMVEVNKETNEVTGEHAEIFNKLNTILMNHEGASYSHPKLKKQLEDAGFELRYSKAKSRTKFKDIQIFHKDAGEAFRSYANLPFQAKRVMENFETYQYFSKGLKIRSDVSATVGKATILVNAFPSKKVAELNKVLYEELGVMLTPSFKKAPDTGRKYVNSWSFYLSRENVKFPILKAGVEEPKKLIITQQEAEDLHEDVERIVHAQTITQATAGIRYTQKNREEFPQFRFQKNETNEEFLARMLASKAYKQSLTSQIAVGNTLISSYNKRTMLDTNGVDSVKVYQANMSSAKSAIQWYVAQGFASIVFKGTENPEIQRMMYIQAVLHDVKIDNYIPSEELKKEAQALLDAERDKVILANKEKIKAHLEAVKADPNGEKQYLYLRSNRKLDIDVDQRPKLYGFLYGIKMGLEPDAFKHMDKLTLTTEERKNVINHFASEEKLNAAQMRDLLIKAGLLSDEDPAHKEPQKPLKASSTPSTGTQPSAPENGTTAPANAYSVTEKDEEKKKETKTATPPNPIKKGNDGLPKAKL
ncbi:hypothetical protein PSE10A_46280 [Pseudomonas amygdali pv. eriobotryae]|uniref:Uncharacterized protein n=1 Tax=Pseudomonas amygdali pv. eriobotryae TaxID=129137 RepID=A0A9P3AHP2_PSEA0|nr:hypothetical protein [Pseudomonas amygdali]GFZ62117.1 hypothetical protein PSE10A_46280 [Pseudomonas amygdali pv. eriobotryae]